MSRVLVIGAGHVGTFAAHDLWDHGHQVVVADIAIAMGFFARFGPAADIPTSTVDALDAASVRSTVQEYAIDTVVLSAGANGTSDALFRVNANAPASVAYASKAAGARRLVLVSSRAVYGACQASSIDEHELECPISAYGKSKYDGERRLIEAAHSLGDLQICIIRSAGTYGPCRFGTGSHSVRLFDAIVTAARDRMELVLTAQRGDCDEYLYVRDLAHAITRAVDTPSEDLPIKVNIGYGEVTLPSELIDAVAKSTGGWAPILETTHDATQHVCAPLCINVARRYLGFVPRFDLAAGLTDYFLATA